MNNRRPRTLLAVLTNPPLTDGRRTLNRVTLAANLLGFDRVVVGNLFALPSHATGAITELGVTPHGWATSKSHLADDLASSEGVLLAFGVTAPSGPARDHFRSQVRWLIERTVSLGLPTWQVGDGPRRPSRWQRWTSRTHPDLGFPEALRTSLVQVETAGAQMIKADAEQHVVRKGS